MSGEADSPFCLHTAPPATMSILHAAILGTLSFVAFAALSYALFLSIWTY